MLEGIAHFIGFLVLVGGGVTLFIYTLSISPFFNGMSGGTSWSPIETLCMFGFLGISAFLVWDLLLHHSP